MNADLPSPKEAVKNIVLAALARPQQPSAWELVDEVDRSLGLKARWHLLTALEELAGEGQLSLLPAKTLTRAQRDYVRSLLESGDIDEALKGQDPLNPIQVRLISNTRKRIKLSRRSAK